MVVSIKQRTTPYIRPTGLSGAGYLIDNNVLAEIMASMGFEKMPEDIINDGRWLTYIIGDRRIVFDRGAKIYFLGVSSIYDYIKVSIRYRAGSYQLKSEPNNLVRPTPLFEVLLRRLVKWKQLDKTSDRLLLPLICIFRDFVGLLVRILGKHHHQRGRYDNIWRTAKTTKNGDLLWKLYNSHSDNYSYSN